MCEDIDHGGRRCPSSSAEARRARDSERRHLEAQGQVEAFIGATPFRPESGELLRMSYRPSYYTSDEWIEYDDTLQAAAERHGVQLIDQEPADGLWLGDTEPAGAYLVRADSFEQITAWASELAGRYNQDSIMAGRFDPAGDARVYQFEIPESRADVVLEALREAGVPGGRTYGGKLEIADVDGSMVPPDTLRVLTAVLGEGTVARAEVAFVQGNEKYKAHMPIKEIQALRQLYAEHLHLPVRKPLPHLTGADDVAAARAYDQAPHQPKHPRVARSYRVFRQHIAAQWSLLASAGYRLEPWHGQSEQPYANSAEMIDDLRTNKHLYYFRTEVSQDTEGALPPDHPMAATVTVVEEGRRREILANDCFRGVHDAIAHSEGHQFGPYGEKRAWWTHRSCLPREARLALWCETRAQNCWTNAGPHMTETVDGKTRILQPGDDSWIPMPDRPYAEQKCVNVLSSLL